MMPANLQDVDGDLNELIFADVALSQRSWLQRT